MPKPNQKGPWRGPSHLRNQKKPAAHIPQRSMDKSYKALTKQRENTERKEQPFDYFLVVDFECTCEMDDRSWPHEIIEFPAVLMDADTGSFVGEFQRYVRPVLRPTLTPFCKNLTGIQQNTVDAAQTLPVVVREFCLWLAATVPAGATVCCATDGPTDLESFMYRMAVKRDRVPFPEVMFTYVDVKLSFQRYFKVKTKPRLKTMLRELGLKFEGREHSGIVDTKNIARLMNEMMNKGVVFGYPLAIRHRPEHVIPGDTSSAFKCVIDVAALPAELAAVPAEPAAADAAASESDGDDGERSDPDSKSDGGGDADDDTTEGVSSPAAASEPVAAGDDDDSDDDADRADAEDGAEGVSSSSPTAAGADGGETRKERPSARLIRRDLDRVRESKYDVRKAKMAKLNATLASPDELAVQRALAAQRLMENGSNGGKASFFTSPMFIVLLVIFSAVNLAAAMWFV